MRYGPLKLPTTEELDYHCRDRNGVLNPDCLAEYLSQYVGYVAFFEWAKLFSQPVYKRID